MKQATPLSRPHPVWLWRNSPDYHEERLPFHWPTPPVSVLLLLFLLLLLLLLHRHPPLQVLCGSGRPRCQSRQSAVAAGSAFGPRPDRSRRNRGAPVQCREKRERFWAETEGAGPVQAPPSELHYSAAQDEHQAGQTWRRAGEMMRRMEELDDKGW